MSAQKKPSTSAIARAGCLTQYSRRPADPLSACNLCSEWADHLEAYREHDEHDWPMPGNDRLLFVGYEHEECERKMIAHARLYEEDTGEPGAFPRLCGPCVYRDGLTCTHRALKANGGPGPGLKVTMQGGGVFMCGEDGCYLPPRLAVECEGFSATMKLVHDDPADRRIADALRRRGWTCAPPPDAPGEPGDGR